MNYSLIAPDHLTADIQLPASKSISNRVLILNALTGQPADINHLAVCDDTDVLVKALRERAPIIDIQGAGTAMRFLTAFLSSTPGEHLLTGNQRMQERPIGVLVDALRQLGADIAYEKETGFPPLRIRGRQLHGGALTIPGNISSQYISALLMIGPYLSGGLELELTGNILSRPYIDMTLALMRQFGAQAKWNGNDRLHVAEGCYRPIDYTVESDWSAASYWYALAALYPQPEVHLKGLFAESCQGDCRVADLFAELGVCTTYEADGIRLQASATPPAKRLQTDFSSIPDLAQTFAVSCCLLGVPFHFTGLESLYIKETDRMHALRTELLKLGFETSEPTNGELIWDGKQTTPSTTPSIATYGDHRMAMAFAPAAVHFGGLVVEEAEVVSKSYPDFWKDLQTGAFFSVRPHNRVAF